VNIIAFIKERARYYKCPACARNLESCEVRMLEQAESHLTVEVTCARCHVTFHVMLGIHAPEDERELADEPAYERAGGDPISDDEILDVHEMLSGFKGNFRDLLRSGDPNAN
jgi:hypothetical protein